VMKGGGGDAGRRKLGGGENESRATVKMGEANEGGRKREVDW
jgi:hypothetical protein